MKKILLSLLVLSSLVSCNNKTNYKYKIVGKVMTKSDTLHDAIAYTDTIYGYNNDSIWYYNSNGSKLTILSPYEIYTIK